jgi:acyl-CoA reductase-like NAD-dependent aldehyde dehydrogenase
MRQPIGIGAGITPFNFPGDDPDVDVRRGDR